MQHLLEKKKLYIIGNGFDIHHGMNTSYKAFSHYLRKNDLELLYLFESYFSHDQSDEDLWSRFEENLANIDTGQLLEDHKDYLPDFGSDEFRDRDMHAFPDTMQHILIKLTDDLISNFTNFIREVEIGDCAEEHKLNIDKGSIFLTFNYTYTLEDFYLIDPHNINHIHNACESKYEDIILGHGLDPAVIQNENLNGPPDNLSKEELADWYENQNDNYDYSFDTGKENIDQYLAKTFKPSQKIIQENQVFFKSLRNIEEILIFGHSLGDVDVLYFEEIINNINSDAFWIISYYEDKDEFEFVEKLKKMGIPQEKIKTTRLENYEIDPNHLKISFKK